MDKVILRSFQMASASSKQSSSHTWATIVSANQLADKKGNHVPLVQLCEISQQIGRCSFWTEMEDLLSGKLSFTDSMDALKKVQLNFGLPNPNVEIVIETTKQYFCGDTPCSACGEPTVVKLIVMHVMFPIRMTFQIPSLPADDQPSAFLHARLEVSLTGSVCLTSFDVCACTPSGNKVCCFVSDTPSIEEMQKIIADTIQFQKGWLAKHRPGCSLVDWLWENRTLVSKLTQFDLAMLSINDIRKKVIAFDATIASN
jgi:hypothetical protein